MNVSTAEVLLAAALLSALGGLALQHRRVRLALRSATASGKALRARDSETAYLAGTRVPALVDALLDPRVTVPGLLQERLTGSEFARAHEAVLRQLADAVDRVHVRADQAARVALKTSMRALQGLANEQELAITAMQERHEAPEVLEDLLHIDHANSQFGRRAQAVAVLCGSWPGQQRAASALTDVVRGATSRIRDYQRIRLTGDSEAAVVSRAVEPVVLAVAELLDNAARHSEPSTLVEVGIQAAHNGTCVVIDDAGIGLDAQEAQRAGAILSGELPVNVTRLGDPPQFGLPVIGVLARRYGFRVSVDSRSPYGGVRAVVFLPAALLTRVPVERPAAPQAATAPVLRMPSRRASEPATFDRLRTPDAPVLPQRRRRMPTAHPSPAPENTPARPAEETASRMGAFARGTRSGRAPHQHDHDDERNTQA